MDTLPSELLVKIFSFLPAEDIVRCQALNKKIQTIIKKNRIYLAQRMVELRICSSTGKNKNNFHISLNNRSDTTFECANPERIRVIEWGSSAAKKFFEPIFQRENRYFLRKTESRKRKLNSVPFHCQRQLSLQEIFNFALQKMDANLMLDFEKDRKLFSPFTEAVKRQRNSVASIRVDGGTDCPEFYDLLRELGKCNPKFKHSSEGVVLIDEVEMWSNLGRLNHIASLYNKFSYAINDITTVGTIEAIAKEWQKSGLNSFFFDILIWNPSWEAVELDFSKFDSSFRVECNKQEIFDCWEPDSGFSIRVEDKKTGNILLFDKLDEKMNVNFRLSISSVSKQ